MADTYNHFNTLAATHGRGSSQNDMQYHFERTDKTRGRSIESASVYKHTAPSGPGQQASVRLRHSQDRRSDGPLE